MVLGGVWDLLGVSWGTFSTLFLRPCCQEGPRGPKRRPRGLLDSIWDGFGGVWEAKIEQKSRFFVSFWKKRWMVKNTFFLMRGVSA